MSGFVHILAILCAVVWVESAVITFTQDEHDFVDLPRPVVPDEQKKGEDSKESWNYVTIRDKAHMFWWLYESRSPKGFENVPLILWLQGGPGASGTGFGNFEEIGPLTVKLEARNSTWLNRASLLFVDNPVGSGYSYVDDKSAYCRDVDCIARDLLALVEHLMVADLKAYQKVPFYIFSESYGGKMAAVFSKYLYQAMKDKHLPINFKGVALGDSWIAPALFVQSWAPYLYSTSLAGTPEFVAVTTAANRVLKAVDQQQWTEATNLWNEAEQVVESKTNTVNFYNILKWKSDETKLSGARIQNPAVRSLYERKFGAFAGHGLTALMNNEIRKKLQIIPKNVTWGATSGEVFEAQSEEFMKPVIDTVDYLLQNTSLHVIVYNGQLDLICDTLGTESWVEGLTWPSLSDFFNSKRVAITDTHGVPRAFVRKYKTFSFYWVLEAGHMIPQDQGESSVMLIDDIFATKCFE